MKSIDDLRFAPESRVPQETVEQHTFETHLNYLLDHYTTFDEGQDGVIGVIDVAQFYPELRDYILENRVSEGEASTLALKLLKIYSHQGAARREADMQKTAFVALGAAASSGESIAQVPEIHFAGAIGINNDSTVKHLQADGVAPGEGNKVDILVMDFIPGRNLATYLYTEVARRHPDLQYLYQEIEQGINLQFNDVVRQVNAALGAEQKGADLEAFYQLMVDYLYKEGFVLDSAILQSIDKAVDILHGDRIFHNDLHERNIILQPDGQGGEKSFIIDYGRSTIGQEIGVSERTERRLLDDFYLHNRYTKLTYSPAQRAKLAQKEFYRAAVSVEEGKLAPEYTELTARLESFLELPNPAEIMVAAVKEVDRFLQEVAKVSPYGKLESYWQTKVRILSDWVDNHPELNAELRRYLTQAAKTDRLVVASLPTQNFLRRTYLRRTQE